MKTKIKPFPKAPSLKHLLGPSFILLGLGLGSGEVILWPYLTSNYGLGIIWAAVLGITFQFFMNMEISRYALVKGESVFVGFNKLGRAIPYWFMASTFVGFVWPGMAAAAAVMLGGAFGFSGGTQYIAIGLLILTGLLFTFGKVLYKMVETFQKTIIFITVPFVFLLTFFLAEKSDWVALGNGLLGQGEGYTFVPEGIVLAVFLSAFAYAGAGGNLNLAQSFYIKAKGYGMGKFAKQITSPITGKKTNYTTTGSEVGFEMNKSNIANFNLWWKRINIEHGLVFWLTGAATMVVLAFLAFITVHGSGNNEAGISFILAEGAAIGELAGPFIGTLFLLAGGVMLFATQMVVYESSSRIISENIAIRLEGNKKKFNVSKLFYTALWSFISIGVIVLLSGFTEPRTLLVLGAVINAFTMLVHLVLMFILNHKHLEPVFRPAWWRKGIIIVEILFFAGFSFVVFWDKFIK